MQDSFLKRLYKGLRRRLLGEEHHEIAYSQEGEDLLLKRLLNPHVNPPGFFVDVGAHHPERFSNTYYFYKLGWRGINIDPTPGSMIAFKRKRPADVNLELSISSTGAPMTFFRFNEPALNTFSREVAESRLKEPGDYMITEELEIESKTLAAVLDEHLLKQQEIDFLTVDAEGMDLDVLKSNNWERFRPRYVVAELLNTDLNRIGEDPVHEFMMSKNYTLISKLVNSVVYSRN